MSDVPSNEINQPNLLEGQPSWFARHDVLSLIIWIGIVSVVMILGNIATFSSVTTWYPTLNKPFFNPPSWLFGPVWTALYMMMAIAAWQVWRRRSDVSQRESNRFFTVAFVIQLVLNLAWSFIFFGLRSPAWAFVEICILWIMIATTIALSFRHSKISGYLLLPYLGWTTFALILNLAIFRLN